jgi:hypothetical protein
MEATVSEEKTVSKTMTEKTLIDEHIYVPAKMLWAVITVAVAILFSLFGGIAWLTSLYGDVQYLKKADETKGEALKSLQIGQNQVETAQSNTNLRLGNIESILTSVAKDVKTLTEQQYRVTK